MARIIKQVNEEIKNVKFVGKMYKMDGNNGFSDKWDEWMKNNQFEEIEMINSRVDDTSYIGFMRWNNRDFSSFEYWIGMFVNINDKTPTGYQELFVPDSKTLVFFVKGEEGPELYSFCDKCINAALEQKYELYNDQNNYTYVFERYNCPRFTNPDENNEVILDFGVFVK